MVGKEIDTLNRIKSKIQERNLDINEPISIENFKKFEDKYSIKLPHEMMLFYTQIANGCQMIDDFNLKSIEELQVDIDQHLERDKDLLSKPFPCEKGLFWEYSYEDFGTKITDYKLDKNGMLIEIDGIVIEDVYNGNIEVIDLGCGMTWNIIVNGVGIGSMWFFCEMGICPCVPSRNFLEWFEYWLDNPRSYMDNEIFGNKS